MTVLVLLGFLRYDWGSVKLKRNMKQGCPCDTNRAFSGNAGSSEDHKGELNKISQKRQRIHTGEENIHDNQ